MSAITPEGLESSLTSVSSTDEKVDVLVEIVKEQSETIERQSEAIEELREEKEEIHSQLDETGQEAAQARERAREAEERVAELEEELSQHRAESAKERAKTKKRVTELEEAEEADTGDETPTPNGGNPSTQEPETPLEEVVQLPEHLADENLSANQQRARFVAKDIHEYSRSVPAGRVIKSSELRRVLTASEEGRVHTETVSRVISFLDDLGQESVKLRETQAGERVVVFTEEIVKRIVAYHNTNHTVVSEGEATG